MHYFNRFTLALVTITTIAFAAMPQRSDADVSIGAGIGASVSAGIGINVDLAPPALPVYVQPAAPFVNAIWQPGYWAWGPYGYYWVPGTWVAAPRLGYLWTPGYWGFGGGYYAWHPGYWATHVGFYGGINYGFGFFGSGFVGGGWFGGAFRYNTAVVNVDRTVIRNTYVDRTVIVNNYNTNITRVSYNGGEGVRAYPTAEERDIAAGPHLAMTPEQRDNVRYAQQNRNNLASVNAGRPMEAAAAHPFSQSNPSQNFERINDQDRANATGLQSHVTTNGQPGYHPQTLGRTQSQFEQSRPQSQFEQSRPQSQFEQSRPQSQFEQSRPQAQTQNRPQSQPQYHAQSQTQYHPQPQTQSRPQQQAQNRSMHQTQPANRYQHSQTTPVQHSAPRPHATGGRPRPPR